jgi:hypothetical protein
MGQLFSGQGLTNPNSALVAPSGQPTFIGSPSQVLSRANAALPSTSQMMGSDVLHPQFNQDAVANLPKIGTPSYGQAASAGAALPGDQNAFSPALTKGGKLATLLMNGLQGALAGRAASEQSVIQSGGRRSTGAGTGFEAGYTLPFVRAQQGQEVRKGEAETQLAEAGTQPVDVGGITVPQAVAPKFLSPYLGYQGKTQAAQIGAGGRTQAATIGAGARTQAAQTEADARIRAAQLNLGPVADVPQDLQQQFGLPAQLPLRMLNQAESAANRPLTTVAGADDTYVVNKQNNQKTPLGIGSPRIAAINEGTVEVADPDHPGDTMIVSRGEAKANRYAGAQSASVQVPRQAAKGEVPTNIGNQRVAFSTMIDHSRLLRQAAYALQNGDVRLLNSISNRAMSEFGDPALTDFNAIANAYNHEVTSVISKGHITDGEVKQGGATMPSDANFETIDKVLKSYESLANSKMQQMDKQINRAKGNVNRQPPQAKAQANDPLGIR